MTCLDFVLVCVVSIMPANPFNDALLKELAQRQLAQEQAQQPEQPDPIEIGPTYPGNKWYRAGQAALIGGNIFDLATTAHGLKQPNVEEKNPFLGDDIGEIAFKKGAVNIGQLLLMKFMADKGHRKLAGITGLISGAIPAALGIHNLGVIKDAKNGSR